MPRPERPGYSPLTRGSRPDRNLPGLPNGPWFPWSREFRWDLMPWNRSLRRLHPALEAWSDAFAVWLRAGSVG